MTVLQEIHMKKTERFQLEMLAVTIFTNMPRDRYMVWTSMTKEGRDGWRQIAKNILNEEFK